MKMLYGKYKREILIGVVVSLITAVILNFADWLFAIMPTVGSSLFETFSNIVYSLAATYSDSILFVILLLAGSGLLMGSIAKSIVDSLKLYRKTITIEKESQKLSPEKIQEINEKYFTGSKEKQSQSEKETLQDFIKKGKKIGKTAICTVIAIVLTYLVFVFFISMPMSLSCKFEQDIIKITPYVEEQDVKKLESDWVCMRSKTDYDNIYKLIDNIKDTYSLPD